MRRGPLIRFHTPFKMMMNRGHRLAITRTNSLLSISTHSYPRQVRAIQHVNIDIFNVLVPTSSNAALLGTTRKMTKNNFRMIPSIIIMGLFFLCEEEYRTSTAQCEANNVQNSASTSVSDSPKEVVHDGEEEEEEEEEETCPFCQFFLNSPCRDEFKPWHTCIKVSKFKKTVEVLKILKSENWNLLLFGLRE